MHDGGRRASLAAALVVAALAAIAVAPAAASPGTDGPAIGAVLPAPPAAPLTTDGARAEVVPAADESTVPWTGVTPVRRGGRWPLRGEVGATIVSEAAPALSVSDGGFGPFAWPVSVRAVEVDAAGGVLAAGVQWSWPNAVTRFDDDGGLDPEFVAPGADGAVTDLAIDDQGRILLAGEFSTVGGQGRSHLARLAADGTLDTGFVGPSIDGTVLSMLRLADGRILIGGGFSSVGGQPRQGVAMLTATGALDPSFGDPQVGGAATRGVTGLAVTPDEDIYAVGDFTTVAGAPQAFVTRLDPDGTRDPGFTAPAMVAPRGLRAVVLPPGGGVIVAGSVTEAAGVPRHGVARLGDDGALDPSLGDVGADHDVEALLVADDGSLVLAGQFWNIDGSSRRRLARVDATGELDGSLGDAAVNGNLAALARQADGEIIVGGGFVNIENRLQAGLARVHWVSGPPAGTPDPTFDGDGVALARFAPRGEVAYDVALQPGGQIVTAGAVAGRGGRFSVVRRDGSGATDPTFGGDGAVQTNFTASDDFARALVIQPDGRIVAVGHAGGDSGPMALARYLADGRLDPSFSSDGKLTIDFGPGPEYAYSVALRPNGRIVVAGEVAGRTTQIGLAQVTRSGRLDPAFGGDGRVSVNLGPGPDWAAGLALQPDGAVVAAGGSIVNDAAVAVVRVEPDGDIDRTFSGDGRARLSIEGQSVATAVTVDRTGRIIVAGGQETHRGQFLVAGITADGELDQTFGFEGSRLIDFSGRDDAAYDLAVTPAGRIVVAGYADGGARMAIARITRRGSLDRGVGDFGEATVDPTDGPDLAFGVAVQPDGRIVVAGGAGSGAPSAAVLRLTG